MVSQAAGVSTDGRVAAVTGFLGLGVVWPEDVPRPQQDNPGEGLPALRRQRYLMEFDMTGIF